MGKHEKTGALKPRTFRLEDSTVEDLDLIAESQTGATGVPHNRTDALRVAVKKEADRIRTKKDSK